MLLSAQTVSIYNVAMAPNMFVGAHDLESVRSGTSVTGRVVIHTISVGSTVYELLRPIQISHSWDNLWFCWAQDFGFAYIGQAETLPKSYENWRELVHADFQNLYRKRVFEMTDREQERWNLLVDVIDVLHYKQNTPLSVREIGYISYGKRSYPTRIRWIHGRIEDFSLSQVPPELAECKPGQWIEAVVKRHPVTNRLLSIEHIQKIKPLFTPSPSQLSEEWESTPRADLPKTKWDWPE